MDLSVQPLSETFLIIIEFFPPTRSFDQSSQILSQAFLFFFIVAIPVVLCNCIFLHLEDNTVLKVRSDFNIAK